MLMAMRGRRKEPEVKDRFQSPYSIVPDAEYVGQIDPMPKVFSSFPSLVLPGHDGKTIYDITRELVNVKPQMRSGNAYVVAINDIRQTTYCGWVAIHNGRFPALPVNKCFTRHNDMILWVFMPLRHVLS